jgi:hypothetical protein
VKVARGQVLVGIDLGIGSGPYDDAFAAPDVFPRLLESIEGAMRKHTGREHVHVRKIALSSWSAGYGAISEILRQPIASKIDSVILLDSLHAGYADAGTHAVNGVQIAHFVVRGYAGNDKPDHCAQIGLIADVLKVHVFPRWHTPAGHGP